MPDRWYADEWLPTRFNLGTFRLAAYVISMRLEPHRPRSGAFLNRERHQHSLEPAFLSIAYWMIPTLQVAFLVGAATGSAVAASLAFAGLLVAVPIGWVLLALTLTLPAKWLSARTGRTTHDIQTHAASFAMLTLAVCSVAFAWPAAALGWIWIGLAVIELVASLACRALAPRFAALERRHPPEAP